MPGLLDDARLESSWVVANSHMNRQRGLVGANSYEKDLGVNPLEILRARIACQGVTSWLDLCCGEGRAMIRAADELNSGSATPLIECVGVDLTDMFAPRDGRFGPRFEVASLHAWQAKGRFDLITCVHGLHYIGDKLGILARACGWLTSDGMLLAHLDPGNIYVDGQPLGTRKVLAALRAQSLSYDSRRSLVIGRGDGLVSFPYSYLGADDAAGPKATGQDAVNSHYRSQQCPGLVDRQ